MTLLRIKCVILMACLCVAMATGCAVIQAVEDGEIAWTRYASYQSIYASLPEYYTE